MSQHWLKVRLIGTSQHLTKMVFISFCVHQAVDSHKGSSKLFGRTHFPIGFHLRKIYAIKIDRLLRFDTTKHHKCNSQEEDSFHRGRIKM